MISDKVANTVHWIPGRSYNGYTDLLSYIIYLKNQGYRTGRFNAINLFSLPTQNWDYIIDFTFSDSGDSLLVRANGMFVYDEKIVFASKQSDGTYAWSGGWKTITFA